MSKKAMPKSKAKTAYGLLGEIQKLITDEPRRYDQTTYKADVSTLPSYRQPACGTVCCIAGWVDTLKFARPISAKQNAPYGFDDSPIFKRGKKVLGLSFEQAEELFDAEAAGSDFEVLLGSAEHAERGVAHIERFRQKHAKQLKGKRV